MKKTCKIEEKNTLIARFIKTNKNVKTKTRDPSVLRLGCFSVLPKNFSALL